MILFPFDPYSENPLKRRREHYITILKEIDINDWQSKRKYQNSFYPASLRSRISPVSYIYLGTSN